MNILKTKVWPTVAGLLTAFVIMMLFEYANSFLFPLPEGLDMKDTETLHVFTASLPWTAYILVLLGWIFGSFKAGCVTTYLAQEHTYKLSFIVGIILTVLGLINNLAIGSSMLFNVIALPVFIIFTYLGHTYLRKVHAGRNK
jgi:hypothetical protein